MLDNVVGGPLPLVPVAAPVRCPHYREAGLNLRAYVCRECAGLLTTRTFGPRGASYTVQRQRSLMHGNRAEEFAALRFQPHIIIRSTKGHNPHGYVNDNWRLDYETQQRHFTEAGFATEQATSESYTATSESDTEVGQAPRQEIGGHEYADMLEFDLAEAVPRMSILQIGLVTFHGLLISVPPPDTTVRPEHKCGHGVMWGADNCRVCSEIVYAGKQARAIWKAFELRKIRPNIGHSRRELFTLDGSADPDAGFVLVEKSKIDRVLGVTDSIDPNELQRYRDIISADAKNYCIECGTSIDRELSYCQDCARSAVLSLVPEADEEYLQTWGEEAAFAETKARPLSGRNIDFGIVRLVARTFICSVLSVAIGQEISSLSDGAFTELCQWSPPMMTLLRRFFLWTRNVPVADIASLEGVSRKAVERYLTRWTEIIDSVTSLLK